MSGAVTEKELAARATGRRVTLDDVMNSIIKEDYLYLGTLTICVLSLWNGFQVTGQSACADPANYKKDIGDRIAKENAVKEIWPLMGFELCSAIMADRLLVASQEVDEREGFETFIGTKVVNAKPYTRGDYNEFRGWKTPDEENPNDEGYLIEYRDIIQNHIPGFEGYVSWSPKEVFERAYRLVGQSEAQPSGKAVEAKASFEPLGVPEHIARVMKERHDLANKLQALEAMFNKGAYSLFSKVDQNDLQEQASFMRGYLMLLDRRLNRHFGAEG